jgi:hypothetical protein
MNPQDFSTQDPFNIFRQNIQSPVENEPAILNPEPDEEDLQLKNLIETFTKRQQESPGNIAQYQNQLKFDPIAAADKRKKDIFKWKDASFGRKLGTVGLNALDIFGQMLGGPGARKLVDEQEQRRFDNIQKTVPQQITNERQLLTDAGDNLVKLQEQKRKRDDNLATIELKKLLDRTKNNTLKQKFLNDAESLRQQGLLTPAKVKLLEAQAKLTLTKDDQANINLSTPISDFDAARRLGTGELGPNFLKDLTAVRGTKPAQQFRPPQTQLRNSGLAQWEVAYDPLTNSYKKQQVQDFVTFDPATQTLKPATSPFAGVNSSSARKTTQQMQKFNDIENTNKTLSQATNSLLDDYGSGRLDQVTGLNSIPAVQSFRQMFLNEPDIAAAITSGQTSSLATLQHLKALYGGRAPQELAQEIAGIVEGRGGSPLAVISAIMSQKYVSEMFLRSEAGDKVADQILADPKFYAFLKKKSQSAISLSKTKFATAAPSLDEIMQEFRKKEYKDSGKPAAQMKPNEGQGNPLVDAFRKRKP